MLDANEIYKGLRNDLDILDSERKRYYNNVKPFQYFLWIILWLIGPFLIIRYNVSGMENILFPEEQWAAVWIIYGCTALFSLIVFVVVHYRNIDKFKKLFTDKVVPKIIQGLGDDFTYQYDGDIGEQTVTDSLLFVKHVSYRCQDLVTGSIDGVPVQFAELNILERTGDKSSHTFSGIFFQAELKASFPTSIWLVGPMYYKARLSKVKQKVILDIPDLKRYHVYSDDPKMAEKILQPVVVDKITALNRRLSKEKRITIDNLRYHFKGNTLQIALPTYRKFMEPYLSRSMHDVSFIEDQVVLLNEISGLMRELTLR